MRRQIIKRSISIAFTFGLFSANSYIANSFSPSSLSVNVPRQTSLHRVGYLTPTRTMTATTDKSSSSKSRTALRMSPIDSKNNDFVKKDVDNNNNNNSLKLASSSHQNILTWAKNNKNALAATAAIATILILSTPAISNAASPITDAIALAEETTSTLPSIMEKIAETGFYQAFSLVFLSEIGDKTFFIAGLLAMKTSRFISFLGAMGALGAMTVISCVIGQIFHVIPSGLAGGLPLDDVAAVAAFAFFGVKILKEAIEMDPEGGGVMDEELAEAEETVEESKTVKLKNAWGQIISTFGLIFAAEFGDRSFLTTIALSAAQNPFSVAGGSIAAHGVATGIAVLGGGAIAKYISEKVIGYISGTLFLVFALTTALGIF